MPASQLSKKDLEQSLAVLKDSITTQAVGVHEDLKSRIRDLVQHFNESQSGQTAQIDARFDEVDSKLTAIMEMLTLRKELRSLIRELKAQGIRIDESKVLVS